MRDLQILFRPKFSLDKLPPVRADAPAAAEAAVAAWCSAFGVADSNRSADFEDWHENAAQLLAAIKSGLPVYVLGDDPFAPCASLPAFNTDRSLPDPAIPCVLIGCLVKYDPLHHSPVDPAVGEPPDGLKGLRVVWPGPNAYRPDRYAENPGFRAAAGRRLALAGIPEGDLCNGDPSGVVEVLRQFAREGERRFMIKVVSQAKYAAPAAIDVADPENPAAISRSLYQELDYALVHLEGTRGSLLVQDRVTMRCEYRVIVIGGVPIAGAGCVEAYCPPYGDGRAFDAAMEVERNSGDVIRDPELADRYAAAAERIAADMVRHDPRMADMTLDLHLAADGSVAAIEANPLLNYGLYCCDYERILPAILRRASDFASEAMATPPLAHA